MAPVSINQALSVKDVGIATVARKAYGDEDTY